jgi:hypothetical protein
MSEHRLKLDSFKVLHRNTLRGFAVVIIEPLGLRIDDVHVHSSDAGVAYAILPSKPQVKPDGTVLRRDDGRIAYAPILKFTTREASDRFSTAVVAAVQARYPEALAVPSGAGEDAA